MFRTQCAGWAGERRGFTLVELLVALTMLTFILSGVYGVFESASRSIRTAEEQGELTQTARVILSDLRRDLGSVYPMRVTVAEEDLASSDLPEGGAVTFAGEDNEDEEGRPRDNLRFTTVVADASRSGAADVAEVIYLIDVDELTPERGLIRRRNDHPGLAVDAEQQIRTEEVSPLATSFNVRYWAGDRLSASEEESTADGWVELWSDPALLPAAVEVELGLTPDRPNAPEHRYRMVVALPLRSVRPDPRPAAQREETAREGEGAGDESGGSDTASGEQLPGGLADVLPGRPGGGDASP
ncbi:MAG: type II secretion system protein [Armatimonadetes bacterium]|nr:type II secretion system protein [Armatimonadota bacterium]